MIKKIIIWIVTLIGLRALGYLSFIIYVVVSVTSGCGMDDGSFEVKLIEEIALSDSIEVFKLKKGNLIIPNVI